MVLYPAASCWQRLKQLQLLCLLALLLTLSSGPLLSRGQPTTTLQLIAEFTNPQYGYSVLLDVSVVVSSLLGSSCLARVLHITGTRTYLSASYNQTVSVTGLDSDYSSYVCPTSGPYALFGSGNNEQGSGQLAYTVSPPAYIPHSTGEDGTVSASVMLQTSNFGGGLYYTEVTFNDDGNEEAGNLLAGTSIAFVPGPTFSFAAYEAANTYPFTLLAELIGTGYNVTINATLQAVLVSGAYESSNNAFIVLSISGTRIFSNASISQTSSITGLAPLNVQSVNGSLLYPFNKASYDTDSSIAYQLSPPGLVQDAATAYDMLSLVSFSAYYFSYGEASVDGQQVAVIGAVRLAPASEPVEATSSFAAIIAARSMTFNMTVTISDPARFTVSIDAQVIGFMIAAAYNQQGSIFLCTGLSGQRTITLVGATPSISTIGPVVTLPVQYYGDYAQNVFYPFDSEQEGVLLSYYDNYDDYDDYDYYQSDSPVYGLSYHSEPAALMYDSIDLVPTTSSTLSLFVVDAQSLAYGEYADPSGAVETGVISSVVFTPGDGFNLTVLEQTETFRFAVLVQLIDESFNVTMNATLTAVLSFGSYGNSDSEFLVLSMTGTRTFCNASVTQSSTITSLLPVDAVAGNDNIIRPFSNLQQQYYDYQPLDGGIGYQLDPPAFIAGSDTPRMGLNLICQSFYYRSYGELYAGGEGRAVAVVGAVTFYEPGTEPTFDLVSYIAVNSYSFNMAASILDQADFTVVYQAQVTGLLISGAYGEYNAAFLGISITGTRTFSSGTVTTTSSLGPMLPYRAMRNNDNTFYPFNSVQSGTIDEYGGLAFAVEPAAPLLSLALNLSMSTIEVSELCLSAIRPSDLLYAEYANNVYEAGLISEVVFSPGSYFNLTSYEASETYTFTMLAVLVDPLYNITIEAVVEAVLLSGTYGYSESSYLAVAINGTRTFINGSTAQTSDITGLLPGSADNSLYNDNLLYPFNPPSSGTVSTLGYTVYPAGLQPGYAEASYAFALSYYNAAAYEVREVSEFQTITTILGAITFTTGYPFDLVSTLQTSLYTFNMQATIEASGVFTAVTNATVVGLLMSGTYGEQSSSYLAISITGTRTFITADSTETQVSSIGPILLTNEIANNENLFFPFNTQTQGTLVNDHSSSSLQAYNGLAYSVSPAASMYISESQSIVTVSSISLAATDASYYQYSETSYSGIEVGDISAVVFIPGASFNLSAIEHSFSLLVQLQDSAFSVTYSAELQAVPIVTEYYYGSSPYLVTSMTGTRTYTSGNVTQVSSITGVAAYQSAGSNTNLIYPYNTITQGTLPEWSRGLAVTVSPPCIVAGITWLVGTIVLSTDNEPGYQLAEAVIPSSQNEGYGALEAATVAALGVAVFTPGVGVNLTTLLADSSYTFNMSALIQSSPSAYVTTQASVVGLLISGTYGQTYSQFLALSITGTRTYINGSIKQVSNVGPLLPTFTVNDNSNYFYPFNSQTAGTFGGTQYGSSSSSSYGLAYTVSPPALFLGSQTNVTALGLFNVDSQDYQYTEVSSSGERAGEVAGSVVFVPGVPFDLLAAESYTFAMSVVMVDSGFTVTINASVTALLISGEYGSEWSSFLAIAINGTRSYASGNVMQTSVITGLAAFDLYVLTNTNLFYPFNTPTDGTLSKYSAGLAFTVSPPATVYGISSPVSTLALGYNSPSSYELSEAVVQTVGYYPVTEIVQETALGAVTFTPGRPFDLLAFLASNSYTFQLLVTIQDTPTFTVIISATVIGLLDNGWNDPAYGVSGSSFLATSLTGTRTFISGNTVQVSTIQSILPKNSINSNDNTFYPFNSPQSLVLDSLAYTVTPAATVYTTAGTLVNTTTLSLAGLSTAQDYQYVEYVGATGAMASGTIGAAAFAANGSVLSVTSLLPSPVQNFSMLALLSLQSSYSIVINATIGAVSLGHGAYLAVAMTGSRTFTNGSGTTTSHISGLSVFDGQGSNTNVFWPDINSNPFPYYYWNGLGFTLSPPAAIVANGANYGANALVLGNNYGETGQYVEYATYQQCYIYEEGGGQDCFSQEVELMEYGTVVFTPLSVTGSAGCVTYEVDGSSSAGPLYIQFPACASDLYSYATSANSTRMWALGGDQYGTPASDVYSSTDGFTTVATTTSMPGTATLYAGAAYLANRNLLYIGGKVDFNSDAASWTSQVLVSSDQGLTFGIATAAAPFSPRSDLCSTAVPQTNIAIICGGQGLSTIGDATVDFVDCWLSSDGQGAVWTRQTATLPPSTFTSTPCVALFDANPSSGIAATFVLTGLGTSYYMSTDNARTFVEYGAPWSAGATLYSQMAADVDSYIYLSNYQSSTLWFSSDKAQSWSTITVAASADSVSYNGQYSGACLAISYVHHQPTGNVIGKRLVLYSGQLYSNAGISYSIQGSLDFAESCTATPVLTYLNPNQALYTGNQLMTLTGSNIPFSVSDLCVFSVTVGATVNNLTATATWQSGSQLQCVVPSIQQLVSGDASPVSAIVSVQLSSSPNVFVGALAFVYYGVCQSYNLCSGHGTCQLGSCDCFSSYQGTNCSVLATPPVLSTVNGNAAHPTVTGLATMYAGVPFQLPLYVLSGTPPINYQLTLQTQVTGLTLASTTSSTPLLTWAAPSLASASITATITGGNAAGRSSVVVRLTVVSPFVTVVQINTALVDGQYFIAPVNVVQLGGSLSILPAAAQLNVSVAYQPIVVSVYHAGSTRLLSATTDANGQYSTQFTPYPGDAGLFSVGADIVAGAAAQVSFHVLLLIASPSSPTLSLLTGTAQTFAVSSLSNPSDVEYTGVQCTSVTLPSLITANLLHNYSLSLVDSADHPIGSTIPASATVTLLLSVISSNSTQYFEESVSVLVKGSMGEYALLTVTLLFQPPHSQLQLSRTSASVVMTPGSITSVSSSLTNLGSASTGVILVSCPLATSASTFPTIALSSSSYSSPTANTAVVITDALVSALEQLALIPAGVTLANNGSYLSSVLAPSLLPPLPAGSAASVNLGFSIVANGGVDVTEVYSLTCAALSITIGATAAVSSSASLYVQVELHDSRYTNVSFQLVDELTYFNASAPGVAGAQITLSQGPFSYSLRADGNGSALLANAPLGSYNVEVSALNHASLVSTLLVFAGIGQQLVFLKYQPVTYVFSVQQSVYQDVITATLDAVFSTNVPVPIVTITPNTISWAELEAGVITSIQFSVSNPGLIEALNVSLALTHPYLQFIFPPGANPISVLSPNTTVQLPMQIIDPTAGSASVSVEVAPFGSGNRRRLLSSNDGSGNCDCGVASTYQEPCPATPTQVVPIADDKTGSYCMTCQIDGSAISGWSIDTSDYDVGASGSDTAYFIPALSSTQCGPANQPSNRSSNPNQPPPGCGVTQGAMCLACGHYVGKGAGGVDVCKCNAVMGVAGALTDFVPEAAVTKTISGIGKSSAEFIDKLGPSARGILDHSADIAHAAFNSPVDDIKNLGHAGFGSPQQIRATASGLLTVASGALVVIGLASGVTEVAAEVISVTSFVSDVATTYYDYQSCAHDAAEAAASGPGGAGRRLLQQSDADSDSAELSYDALDQVLIGALQIGVQLVTSQSVDPTVSNGQQQIGLAGAAVLSMMYFFTVLLGSAQLPLIVDFTQPSMVAFLDSMQTFGSDASDGGFIITDAEYTQLFSSSFAAAFVANYSQSLFDDLEHMVQRNNRTAYYYSLDIFTLDQAEAAFNITAEPVDATDLQADPFNVSPPNQPELDFIYYDQAYRVIGQANTSLAATSPDLTDYVETAINNYQIASSAEQQGVCAQVTVQLTKQTITAGVEDFIATLKLSNAQTGPLTAVFVQLVITAGNASSAQSQLNQYSTANSLFFVQPQPSTGLSGGDASLGTAVIPAGGAGTFQWLILPYHDAAPTSANVLYQVSGQFSYTQNGLNFTVPLLPASITVYPSPSLQMDYFLPTIVYGDDPFTPLVEPSIPFSVGLLLSNAGPGQLLSLSLQSTPPEILDNAKQLLISFQLVGSAINGQPLLQSALTNVTSVGAVAADTVVDYNDILTVSLMGTFISYNVTLTETLASLSKQLAIVSSLNKHSLVQKVYLPALSRGAYLADDLPDPPQPATDPFSLPIPDTLHVPVADAISGVAASVTIDAMVNDTLCIWNTSTFSVSFPVVQLSVPVAVLPAVYYRCVPPTFGSGTGLDPVLELLPAGYSLVSAQQLGVAGAAVLPASVAEMGVSSVWFTSRTIRPVGKPAFAERYFHLFDPQQQQQQQQDSEEGSPVIYAVTLYAAPVVSISSSSSSTSSYPAASSAESSTLSSTAQSSSAASSSASSASTAASSTAAASSVSSTVTSSVTSAGTATLTLLPSSSSAAFSSAAASSLSSTPASSSTSSSATLASSSSSSAALASSAAGSSSNAVSSSSIPIVVLPSSLLAASSSSSSSAAVSSAASSAALSASSSLAVALSSSTASLSSSADTVSLIPSLSSSATGSSSAAAASSSSAVARSSSSAVMSAASPTAAGSSSSPSNLSLSSALLTSSSVSVSLNTSSSTSTSTSTVAASDATSKSSSSGASSLSSSSRVTSVVSSSSQSSGTTVALLTAPSSSSTAAALEATSTSSSASSSSLQSATSALSSSPAMETTSNTGNSSSSVISSTAQQCSSASSSAFTTTPLSSSGSSATAPATGANASVSHLSSSPASSSASSPSTAGSSAAASSSSSSPVSTNATSTSTTTATLLSSSSSTSTVAAGGTSSTSFRTADSSSSSSSSLATSTTSAVDSLSSRSSGTAASFTSLTASDAGLASSVTSSTTLSSAASSTTPTATTAESSSSALLSTSASSSRIAASSDSSAQLAPLASSSSGASSPSSTFPLGSVLVGFNISNVNTANLFALAADVRYDVAFNLARESTDITATAADFEPYVTILSVGSVSIWNNTATGGVNRRLLQLQQNVPVVFVLLSTVSQHLSDIGSVTKLVASFAYAAANSELLTPTTNATIPAQLITSTIVGPAIATVHSSSSSSTASVQSTPPTNGSGSGVSSTLVLGLALGLGLGVGLPLCIIGVTLLVVLARNVRWKPQAHFSNIHHAPPAYAQQKGSMLYMSPPHKPVSVHPTPLRNQSAPPRSPTPIRYTATPPSAALPRTIQPPLYRQQQQQPRWKDSLSEYEAKTPYQVETDDSERLAMQMGIHL